MTRLFAALMGLAMMMAASVQAASPRTAIFAGGCFWCVESDFDKVPGVLSTLSGYTGGTTENPNYQQVGQGGTGHYEAVEIKYDPDRVSFDDLLTVFWHSVDPTDDGGQFCDRGHSYKTAVFATDAEQRATAESSKAAAETELGQAIVTPILAAAPFYAAEDYHQDYYDKNPIRYRYYRWGCGRDKRIEEVWGAAAFKGLPEHE